MPLLTIHIDIYISTIQPQSENPPFSFNFSFFYFQRWQLEDTVADRKLPCIIFFYISIILFVISTKRMKILIYVFLYRIYSRTASSTACLLLLTLASTHAQFFCCCCCCCCCQFFGAKRRGWMRVPRFSIEMPGLSHIYYGWCILSQTCPE